MARVPGPHGLEPELRSSHRRQGVAFRVTEWHSELNWEGTPIRSNSAKTCALPVQRLCNSTIDAQGV